MAYSLQDPDNWKDAFGEETAVDDAVDSPWDVTTAYYDGEQTPTGTLEPAASPPTFDADAVAEGLLQEVR